MDEILTGLLDAIRGVDPTLRVVIAGIAIMLETSVLIGLIVPGDTVVIVAGTAVASFEEGLILAAVVVLGALVGESIGFWLGRLIGPWVRQSWVGRRIGEANWQRSERYLERRGGVAIFLSRFLPVLHSLVPLTVGMSRYSYRRFLAWTTPACIIWSALYVSVAAAAAGTYRQLSGTIHFAAYLFVGIIALFLILVFIGKKLIQRVERKHLSDDSTQAPATTDDDVEH